MVVVVVLRNSRGLVCSGVPHNGGCRHLLDSLFSLFFSQLASPAFGCCCSDYSFFGGFSSLRHTLHLFFLSQSPEKERVVHLLGLENLLSRPSVCDFQLLPSHHHQHHRHHNYDYLPLTYHFSLFNYAPCPSAFTSLDITVEATLHTSPLEIHLPLLLNTVIPRSSPPWRSSCVPPSLAPPLKSPAGTPYISAPFALGVPTMVKLVQFKCDES